eukprot:scpid63381/ scgid3787/ 
MMSVMILQFYYAHRFIIFTGFFHEFPPSYNCRFQRHSSNLEPTFFFGDFNFRLDLHQLVFDMCSSTNRQLHRHLEGEQVIYSDSSSGEVVLQMAPKVFRVADKAMFEENFGTLRSYDKEAVKIGVHEQGIDFQPR